MTIGRARKCSGRKHLTQEQSLTLALQGRLHAMLQHCGLWQALSPRVSPDVEDWVLEPDVVYSGRSIDSSDQTDKLQELTYANIGTFLESLEFISDADRQGDAADPLWDRTRILRALGAHFCSGKLQLGSSSPEDGQKCVCAKAAVAALAHTHPLN